MENLTEQATKNLELIAKEKEEKRLLADLELSSSKYYLNTKDFTSTELIDKLSGMGKEKLLWCCVDLIDIHDCDTMTSIVTCEYDFGGERYYMIYNKECWLGIKDELQKQLNFKYIIKYHPNGSPSEKYYKNSDDKLDVIYVSYWENGGVKSTIEYKNGIIHGYVVERDENDNDKSTYKKYENGIEMSK